MLKLLISSIVVRPDRQRTEFSVIELAELRDSIVGNGLMQLPVVRQEGSETILVAGERRIRAVSDAHSLGMTVRHGLETIPPGMMFVTDFGELTPLQRAQLEYEENAVRVDLSWQDKARVTGQLMELRRLEAEAAGKPAPNVSAIALERRGSSAGVNHVNTRNELLLQPHLDDPEVAGARSLKDAVKILQAKELREKHIKYAEQIKPASLASKHRVIHGDSLEWMKNASGNLFDVILTDPPYGMGADDFGDSGGKAGGSHDYEDSAESWYHIMESLPSSLYNLTAPNAHAYIFCDIDKFPYLRKAMLAVGWKCFRTPLIWHKPQGNRAPWPHHGPHRRYETILYAMKGDRKVRTLASDVITCNSDENIGHRAQKPVELFRELLSRSVSPGDRVFDPFCGSGPIFPAAQALQCVATGIELDIASYGIALSRIAELK